VDEEPAAARKTDTLFGKTPHPVPENEKNLKKVLIFSQNHVIMYNCMKVWE
jgi:hypothetical protein